MKKAAQSQISTTRKPKTVFLETFGCQMNELDSELVRGHLKAMGYGFVADPEQADVILYNTCSVREQAENKVWSRIGIQGLRKKEGANFVLGVIGCMAERDGTDMIRRFPQVDLMCGPGELDKLPLLIDNVCKTEAVQLADRVALQGNNSRRASTLDAANDNLELLDLSRAFDPDASFGGGKSAYVRITRGCNKFCTYCVVPYTRGAEVHRPPDSIVDECKKLADQGVIEVTLLGQTVNHYIYTHGTALSAEGLEVPQVGPGAAAFKNGRAKPGPSAAPARVSGGLSARTTTFADLLKRIHDEVPAIQRLRFVTSFPRDFGDDILQVIADSPRICRYLHVPAQSGSNRILKLMNRGYTAEEYLEFLDRARGYLPDVCIAGDFIVGFPTETDEDFELTTSLLRNARCKNSFIFKYSARPGTAAIDRFADDVPEHVKRRRNNELLRVQSEVSAQVHAECVGRTVEVFVEQVSRANVVEERQRALSATHSHSKCGATALTISANGSTGAQSAATAELQQDASSVSHSTQMSGRTGGDLIAVFDLPPNLRADDLLGRIVRVEVTGSAPLLLHGRLVNGAPE